MAAFSGAEAAAAHAAAIAKATRAMGPIVRVEPTEFVRLVSRLDQYAVVTGKGGFFVKKFQYLTNYKGLFLYTDSKEPLQLGHKAEIIESNNIWIPRA
ncbi:MAG: hypothetical protein WAU88_14095 [Candidatus Zixiibacteriota bacterium]